MGGIDTYQYLSEHGDDYLFVGGIGQVPIEAASFGIPALLLSSSKEMKYSTFLTADRLPFFIKWNFVINACPKESLGNIDEFFCDISHGKLERYSITQENHNTLSVEVVMKKYMDIVKSCRNQRYD